MLNSGTITALLQKKIAEQLYEQIDYNTIKCSQDYYIDLMKIEKQVLVQDYIGTFGDIVTMTSQYSIIKYKDSYIITVTTDSSYLTGVLVHVYSNTIDGIQSTLQDFKNHLEKIDVDDEFIDDFTILLIKF